MIISAPIFHLKRWCLMCCCLQPSAILQSQCNHEEPLCFCVLPNFFVCSAVRDTLRRSTSPATWCAYVRRTHLAVRFGVDSASYFLISRCVHVSSALLSPSNRCLAHRLFDSRITASRLACTQIHLRDGKVPRVLRLHHALNVVLSVARCHYHFACIKWWHGCNTKLDLSLTVLK